MDRTISYSEPLSNVLRSVASAPCAFAKSRTFWPASSGDTVASDVVLITNVITNNIARTIVEIAQ